MQAETFHRRLAKTLLAAFLLFVAAAFAAYRWGLRYNFTGSMPTGFYRVLTTAGIERGALVVVCPDLTHPAIRQAHERGYLRPGWGCGRIAPMLKRVHALSGDRVDVAQEGILVNGEMIEKSSRLTTDRAGRSLPQPAGGIVPPNHFWVLGESLDSFDSRYFGPIPILHATAATPL